VTQDDLRREQVDVVIIQRPEELGPLWRDWLPGRRPGRDLPVVYLEHSAPQGRINEMRHPMADRDDLLLVHVTHFNRLFWETGRTEVRVIEHGVIDPGLRYTGELSRAAVVINDSERRGRVVGADLLPLFSRTLPLDRFGIGTASNFPQWRLHEEMARRRVYLHPYRWTSLGLTLLEAMHLGVPVVAFATTEVTEAVPPGAGVVSNRLPVVEDALAWLAREPEDAVRMGRAGRAAALARYGLTRFLDDWDDLLLEVSA
jgi:glycosyltransferase involved in cell wall biosynthesis